VIEIDITDIMEPILEGNSNLPTRRRIDPPTKMGTKILNEQGYYFVLGKSGAHMKMQGCCLCMGNPVPYR